MSVVDDIQAVRARTDLTLDEKRAAIYDLKGQAIVDAFAGRVGQSMVRGQFTLTLTEAPTWADRRLTFTGLRLTRNGIGVPLNLPLSIVNPPLMVPDGAGGYVLNVLQAIRDAIMDMVH